MEMRGGNGGTDLTCPADSRPVVVILKLTGQNLRDSCRAAALIKCFQEMGKTELTATSGFKGTKHSTHENEVVLARSVLMQIFPPAVAARLQQMLRGKRGRGRLYVYKRRL